MRVPGSWTGAQQLSTGTSELATGAQQLSAGTSELATGARISWGYVTAS